MKKSILLSAVVLLIAVSANVFAQSTGTTPAPGATHEYSITPGNAVNSITWTVTKGDLTTDASGDVTISASTDATTNITWASGLTAGDWYYVHVTESDGSCTNTKVLPVQITASPFYLTLAGATDQCYDGAVSVNLDLTTDPANPAISYDHGNATLVFTVTPAGLSSSYAGYSFDIGIDFGAYTGLNADNVSVSNNGSGTASISSGVVTVSDNSAVTITYVVDNQTLFTNTTDANGDAADYTATVSISGGLADNGVADNGSGTDSSATNVARPNTSGISTN